MASVVDTLRIYERLRKTDLSEGAAKEITEIVRDVVEGQFALLATKDDLLTIKQDVLSVKEEVQRVREDVQRIVAEAVAQAKAEIIKWVAGMLVAQAAIVATLVKLL